jgi:Mn2+/Fe2+ NRAMP family transporter
VRLEEPQLELATTPAANGIVVRSAWQKHVLTFLMVFGPGLIVMEADNDAGAVSTYMQAGGQYGLHLLWLLVVLLPICYFVQEMVARLGIATGKGHAAMIYERFGKWWGRFSLIDLLAVNFLTLITEFAAISLALSALGVSPYVSVPIAALGLTLMVITGSYLRWERIVIVLCLIDLTWFGLAYGYQHGIPFRDPAQFAGAILPTAGHFARNGILLLMVNAAVLGTTAISLASAWAYGEVKGWEHSLHKKLWEAPGFYATYVACVGAAAAIVLIPHVPLQLVIISVQVFAGLILPSAIIFLQLLLNDHALLGDRWVNRPWNNWINWTIIVVLFALSLLLAAQVMLPKLFA